MFTKSCAKAADKNRQELFMDSLLGDFQKMKEKALNQQQEKRSPKRALNSKSSEKQKTESACRPYSRSSSGS